jgi:hypothetical protein
MLTVKGYYEKGTIKLLEPLPTEIRSAELTIMVTPKNTEEDFKQISLNAFLNSEDDADIDWEDYFGIK